MGLILLLALRFAPKGVIKEQKRIADAHAKARPTCKQNRWKCQEQQDEVAVKKALELIRIYRPEDVKKVRFLIRFISPKSSQHLPHFWQNIVKTAGDPVPAEGGPGAGGGGVPL